MIIKYYLSKIVNNPDEEVDNYIPEIMVSFERAFNSPLNEVGMNAEVVSGRKHFRALDKLPLIRKQDMENLVGKWCVVEVTAPRRLHRMLNDQGFETLTNSKGNLKKKTARGKIRAKDPELVQDFIRRFD